MVMSKSTTVSGYLDEMPDDRRRTITAMRKLVNASMPKGYEESMLWGMISWSVPLSRYPDTYNGQSLCYVALASQKNYCSLYLMGVYGHPARERLLIEGFKAAGKKLDVGKSCIRFQGIEDLPVDVIRTLISSQSPNAHIAQFEKAHEGRAAGRKAAKAGGAKKVAVKKTPKKTTKKSVTKKAVAKKTATKRSR